MVKAKLIIPFRNPQLVLSVSAGVIPGAFYVFESNVARCTLLLPYIYVGQLLCWILLVSWIANVFFAPSNLNLQL